MSLMFMNEQEVLVADLPSGRPPVLHPFTLFRGTPPFYMFLGVPRSIQNSVSLLLSSSEVPSRSTLYPCSYHLFSIWFTPVLHPFLKTDKSKVDPGQLIHNWYDASIFFLHEADFLRIHDIRSVQAIAILLGLAKNVGDFNLQPVLQATGLRIGHCLGIDRVAPTSSAVAADPILQEVSHRMWWTLVICEWLQRPDSAPLIHEADFDVPLPLNLTDEELLDPYLREHPDEVDDCPRPVQYHHAMIGLAQVRYRFKMEVTRLRQYHLDDNEQYFKRLEELVSRSDEALANLIVQLPDHLSSENLEDEDDDETCVIWQRISLSLSFLFYRMAVNRELQYRWVESSSSFAARSQAICLASAHAIVSLVDRHSDAFMRHRPW